MMLRSILTEKLNKHTWLQFIFVIFPVIMVVIYGYAYMSDMLGYAQIFSYNDSISERAFNDGELREVVYTEDGENGKTKAIIAGDDSDIVEVAVDDVIFYVQMYSADWYQLVTASGKGMFAEQCDLFVVEDLGDGMFKVTGEGDFEHEFEAGDLICGVTISSDGAYRVTFLVDDGPYYDLDNLHMLELLPSDKGGSYKVRVSSSYETEVDVLDTSFCTNLPTDGLYFNEATQSFVRNVSKDYAKTFILRSNILIVFLAAVLYFVLLYEFLAKESKLSLVQNDNLRRANGFAVCMIPVCIILTLIML